MRRKSEVVTPNNELNTEKVVMEEMRTRKAVRHTENKLQNGRSPVLSVITLNINRLNFPVNGR